jgi:hypothetical protein
VIDPEVNFLVALFAYNDPYGQLVGSSEPRATWFMGPFARSRIAYDHAALSLRLIALRRITVMALFAWNMRLHLEQIRMYVVRSSGFDQ